VATVRLAAPISQSSALGFQNLEGTEETFAHGHHGSRVVKRAAIVWRREDCDEPTIREKSVSVLDDLVSSAYEIEVVLFAKLRHDIRAERDGYAASVVVRPLGDGFGWV